MYSAFAIVSTTGAACIPDEGPLTSRPPNVDTLGFAARANVRWHSDSQRTWLYAWQSEAARADTNAWQLAQDGISLSIGVQWPCSRPWPYETRSSSRSPSVDDGTQLVDIAERVEGMFLLVHLHRSGRGTVVGDSLGLRCLYFAEHDVGSSGVVSVVASRAALAARVLASCGVAAARDPLAVCALAHSRHLVGDRTGFEHVRVLPPGTAVHLNESARPSLERRTRWIPSRAERASAQADLAHTVDAVRDHIADLLHTALSAPFERRVIGLTGGRDSRLILSVALWAGIAHEFDYETVGPPHLVDVQIASALAARFGLRHESRFLGVAPTQPYSERFHDFVRRTAGMVNAWDLGAPNTDQNELRIVGFQSLRSTRHIGRAVQTIDELRTLYPPGAFGRLRLLRADIADGVHSRLLEDVLDDPSHDCEPADLFDFYELVHSPRFSLFGPHEELPKQPMLYPLFSASGLRVAIALGALARQAELIHFDVMRQCCAELVEYEFAGPAWNSDLLGREVHMTAVPKVAPRATPAPAPAPNLMQLVQARGIDERRPILREILHDQQNPAWDFIDGRTAREALERFETLTFHERRELYGAATAAAWLGGSLEW